MIIPIKCFTCNNVIGHLWEKYQELIKTKSNNEALNEINFSRICCRRMFLSHVETCDILLKYKS
jgi:DNA-directed RNA polymerases I, II, and III subunit RPABC5